MAVLFGKSTDFAAPSESNTYAADTVQYFDAGYVAGASGTANTCFFRPGPVANWGACTGAKVTAHNSSGTLLATASFVPADGSGWISKAWDVSFAVTSGQTYYLAVTPNTAGTLAIVNSGNGFESKTGTGTYASPGNINPGTDSAGTKSEFNVYADGTVGGGGSSVKALTLLGVG